MGALRTFQDVPAARKAVPVLLGAFGASGSGKTFSSLRLAAGMERISGKPTYVIDTEAGRALHYADLFKFRHVPFLAPFGPLDYLAAIEHCVRQGAGQIVVDSGSHVWEGEGGVLEMHEAELERLAGNDFQKRERVKMLAWVRPKAEFRRLINSLLQIHCNFIFCFRAKEKMKIVKGKEPVALGYQPIISDEFTYEMTMNLFLPPASNGVPDLTPGEVGERAMVKVPVQFRQMLRAGATLDEALGEQLAQWAAGGEPPPATSPASRAQPPSSPLAGAPLEDSPEAALVAKVKAVLKAHDLGTPRLAAEPVLAVFGTNWTGMTRLPADQLEIGLATLTKNLNGLAAMRERQPGEDPEEEV